MREYLPACKAVSTHGVRGEMKCLVFCDDVQFLAKCRRLFENEDGTGERKVLAVRAQGTMALLRLEGIEDMDAARSMAGKTFYFAKSDIHLPRNMYFVDDLLGCTVQDADTGTVYGTLTEVDHPGAQDIYTVTDEKGTSYMMPAVPAFVKSKDVEKRLILVTPIPGLFGEAINGDAE